MGFFSTKKKHRQTHDDDRSKRHSKDKEEVYHSSSAAHEQSNDSDAELARRLQDEEQEDIEELPFRGKGKSKEPEGVTFEQIMRPEGRRSKPSNKQASLKASTKERSMDPKTSRAGDKVNQGKPFEGPSSENRRFEPTALEQDMEMLRQHYKTLKRVGCRKCKCPLLDEFDPEEHVTEWMNVAHEKAPDTDGCDSLCAVLCPECKAVTFTCAGCGKKPTSKGSEVEVDKLSLRWCCEAGRLFSIWVLLCRYDDEEIHNHNKAESTTSKPSRDTRNKAGTGTGYAGSYDRSRAKRSHGHGRKERMDVSNIRNGQSDKLTQQTMELVTALLPKTGRSGSDSFDSSPPKQLSALLKCSLIMDKAAELVSNDSVQDATTRYALYTALFDFIKRIGSHQATRALVHDEREIKRQTAGLFDISLDGSKAASLADPKDSASSIATRLRDVVAQAQTLIEGANNVSARSSPGYEQSTSEAMMKLCRQCCDTAKSIGMVSTQNEDLGNALNVRTAWEKYEKVNHLTYVEDDQIINPRCYHFCERLSARGAPKRMQRVLGECATMKTSLPPGVFVKACMSRPDVMKALIIGPPDTPYEGGLFEFDILLPGEYPRVPPRVHFRTPNWSADFNPNIHKKAAESAGPHSLEFEAMGLIGGAIDMAVCLSLLNTWPGEPSEQWQPNKSNLLQVLLSVQSMIFVPEPFFNEPGAQSLRAELPQTSARYNKVREPMTVFYGMLLWLREPGRRDGVWKEVVREYFKANADRLVKVVRKWARRNEEITRWHGYITSATGGFGSIVEPRGRGKNLLTELESSLAPYRELG